jgi:C1A family cysteine protease
MANFIRGKGCLPDVPDERDYKLSSIPRFAAMPLPTTPIDLRPYLPNVYDQGQVGSCTAQSFVGACETQFNRLFPGKKGPYSKMFVYYMARRLQGWQNEDSGSTLRDVCKIGRSYGNTKIEEHPENTPFNQKPTFDALADAIDGKINSFYRVDTYEGILQALQAQRPVLFAAKAEDLDDANAQGISQKFNQFAKVEDKNQADHAMLIVGYLPEFMVNGVKTPVFIVRNSWGNQWGQNGFAYIPARDLWDYHIADCWVVFISNDPIDEPMAAPVVTPSQA